MKDQLNIFGEEDFNSKLSEIHKVTGLSYIPNFISQKTQNELIKSIDNENWLDDLKRRVQHYGYKYNYKSRRIDYSMKIGALPSWVLEISKKLCNEGYFNEIPDQVIVNEYLSGQGITKHIDCEPCFEDTIVSLSLLDPVVMNLIDTLDKNNIVPILLEPGSIVVLKDEARYNWLHEIRSRKTHEYFGKKFKLNRRVSLTFRSVIIN